MGKKHEWPGTGTLLKCSRHPGLQGMRYILFIGSPWGPIHDFAWHQDSVDISGTSQTRKERELQQTADGCFGECSGTSFDNSRMSLWCHFHLWRSNYIDACTFKKKNYILLCIWHHAWWYPWSLLNPTFAPKKVIGNNTNKRWIMGGRNPSSHWNFLFKLRVERTWEPVKEWSKATNNNQLEPQGQPFINGCLVISNHFLCKDWESSNWNNHL